MTQTIEHIMVKEDATIKIFSNEQSCAVTADVEIEYTKGESGWMKSGSSSYEDLGEPPSAGDIKVVGAKLHVVIFDEKGTEIGELNLEGIDWFDLWFDDPEESDFL